MQEILGIIRNPLARCAEKEEHVWNCLVIDEDKLTNREADLFFNVNCGCGAFGFFQKKKMFAIHTLRRGELFDYGFSYIYEWKKPIRKVVIGFYDKDDKLIKKLKVKLYAFYLNGTLPRYAYCKSKKVASEVIDYIKNGNGRVRFIIPRFEDPNFDMSVNCASNFKKTTI